MKRFCSVVIFLFCFSTHAWGYNALQDHQKYKNQLKNDYSKQINANKQNIYYYKGKNSYSKNINGIQKTPYKKTGVKFNIKQSKNITKQTESSSKKEKNFTITTETKQEKNNHNADAE